MFKDENRWIKNIYSEPFIDPFILDRLAGYRIEVLVSPSEVFIKKDPPYNRIVLRLRQGIITIQRFIHEDYGKVIDEALIVEVLLQMVDEMDAALKEVAEDTSIVDKFVTMGESTNIKFVDQVLEGEEK